MEGSVIMLNNLSRTAANGLSFKLGVTEVLKNYSA